MKRSRNLTHYELNPRHHTRVMLDNPSVWELIRLTIKQAIGMEE